ncbi:PREDICTED: vacuolar protein sorting-associated protein 13C-like [Amphimedon queenslandica]|nr:PREDICTED: vacuolar protein sorting-associated protein 13C-like [Amphimedon queenslandica]|eukprot:XP_019853628.1 PREDICTED: vacuolar protein sorting-associated protein 13C-like [Amphimedon queenslandica]
MVSLTFKQDPQLHQRTGLLNVSNPLVTISIEYLLYLIGYLKTLYEPFLSSTPSQPSPLEPPKSEADGATVEQYEMKLTGSIVNVRLAASGDEPNQALIAQTGVSLGISLKDGSISIHSSLDDCTLYTGSPTAKTTVNKDNIILSPCTLSFTLSTMSGHNIVLHLKRVELFVAPSTVRLVLSILNKIQAETNTEGEKEKRVITAPPDLLLNKPVDESKWYFKSQEHIISRIVQDSHLDGKKGELLMLDIDQVSITLLQEHPRTGEVSSAFSILLGSYGNKGLHLQAQEWSGELWAEANLSLIVSYFNTSCDVWEPMLEPVVDLKDDNRYSSWQVTATVEKDINSTGNPELSACIKSASALQITLSSTGINMLSGLANDYMKSAQQALAIESADSSSDEASSKDQRKSFIIIKNHVGKEFPVQLSPVQNIERESGQSETGSSLRIEYMSFVRLIRHTSSNYQLRGEILPPDVIKKEQAILSVQIKGYKSFDVTVSSSGLTYHLLKPIEKGDRLPVVVEVNKVYATDPTEVIIRSSLQLKNHLSVPVSVYWSKEKHDPNVSGLPCVLKIKEGESSAVPLSCVNSYLYLKPDTGGVCSNGVSWHSLSENGVYLHCKSMYIHVYSLAENYSNYLSVPPGPHHMLHIHYPFVLHNYLHNKLRVSGTDILSGSFVNVSHINPEKDTKLPIEFSMGDGVRLLGHLELSDSMENDDIKLKSEEGKGHSVHLSVIHEVRGGTRHVNLFSPYWLINKTGLTLEFSHKAHHWGSKDSGILSKGTDLVLFSSDKVSVRVKTKDGSWSDWSKNFSLDTVGSEGIVSSSTDNKVYQMGFTCKMATFSFTKVITLTPFYMIHNKTEDIITVLEYDRPVSDTIKLKPKEFVSFWPQINNGKILVDVLDEPSLTTWSSPFDYRIKGSYLLRLNSAKVSAVTVHVSVSGFANVITFLPYTTGAAPLQLINTLPVNIEYGQATKEGDSVVKVRVLPSGVSRLFVWDDLNAKKEVLWRKEGTNTSFKKYSLKDDHGSIYLSLADGGEADLKKQIIGISLATAKLKGSVKRIRGGGGEGQKEMATDDNKGYWVSFTDDLQRVLLFTPDKEVVDTALGTRSVPSLNATLSIVAIGLSLVNSNKGIEVAYIGLPQSPVLWEIEKSRKQWKAVEIEVSDKLEELYGKKKKNEVIKISGDVSIEFSNEDEVYLINSDKRSKLRRSYFNGLTVKVTKSQQMTTFNLRINKVQVDNQLPNARNPSIFYCYPPPPKVGSSAPPKPFLELSLVLKNNHDIQFLQTLIQEMGLIIDLDWLVELIPLFQFLAAPKNDEELLQEQIKMTKTSLQTLVATSSASSSSINKTFFKFVHLSPIDLHLTFSLKLSDKKKEEISFFADQNFIFKYVLNLITSVVGLFAQANDAELKLGYFEIKEQALTTKALQNRIIDHYKQQFLYQLYSVVLSLEVIGNPVGFLRGFTEGTVDLFYQPFQGAVVGPEEFFEGLALGTHQFIGGTVGGVIGIGAGVTRVLGDSFAKLTFDSEYQESRPEQKSFGRGVETLGKGFYQGLTGIVTQPVKGAMKEGVLGFIKGTGKGVLGLVFKPTGGLIDFTSATLLAVQRTTQVGELNLMQLRIARYIGNDKVIRPFSLTVASGYAVFIDYNNGELYGKEEYIGHVDLNDDPIKIFIATDKQVMILRKNTFFDKWSCDWSMEMKEVVDKPFLSSSTGAERAVLFPRMEHQGGVFGFGGKKSVKSNFSLNIPNEIKAKKIVALSLQSYNTFALKL